MADMGEIARLVADCASYWRETGVPRRAIEEMRTELTEHLTQTAAEGRDAHSVIGADPAEFAEAWAAEFRQRPQDADWNQVAGGKADRRRANRRATTVYGVGIVALISGAIVGSGMAGGGRQVEDMAFWGWFWTASAIVLGVGEIFTAGFFMFPFAVGATAAAILAWMDIDLITQWLVFFGVSLISLVYLRRFVKSDSDQPKVGAFRLDGAIGVVIIDIESGIGKGMAKIESEEWRAQSKDGRSIPAGTPVRVEEVRGSRLIVTPVED